MLEFMTAIPPRYRLWIYFVASLTAMILGVWRASDGHWDQFAGLLASALVSAMAQANVRGSSNENEPPRT